MAGELPTIPTAHEITELTIIPETRWNVLSTCGEAAGARANTRKTKELSERIVGTYHQD